MTDEEKLQTTKMAFEMKLAEINTWDEFKIMLSQITKAKVINFIKTNLQKAEQSYIDSASHNTNMASDISNLITEVDNL